MDESSKLHVVDNIYSSSIKETFYGSVRKLYVCGNSNCKFKTSQIDEVPYFVIPADGSVIGGVKSIARTTSSVFLCDKCKLNIMHSCTTSIWHQPKCSILLVNRFIQCPNGNVTKSGTALYCDQKVDVPGFKGQLISFITHLGLSTTSGHYMASVLNNSKWYRCNDASVTLTNQNFHSNEVYLLFYIKE